jgi:hypothetical protein
MPPPPSPVTDVSSDPVKVRPADDPARVPELLLKSTSPAKAARGTARASTAIKTIRFMIYFLPELLENPFF